MDDHYRNQDMGRKKILCSEGMMFGFVAMQDSNIVRDRRIRNNSLKAFCSKNCWVYIPLIALTSTCLPLCIIRMQVCGKYDP